MTDPPPPATHTHKVQYIHISSLLSYLLAHQCPFVLVLLLVLMIHELLQVHSGLDYQYLLEFNYNIYHPWMKEQQDPDEMTSLTWLPRGPDMPVGPPLPVGPAGPMGPVCLAPPALPVGPAIPGGPGSPIPPVGPSAPAGPTSPYQNKKNTLFKSYLHNY